MTSEPHYSPYSLLLAVDIIVKSLALGYLPLNESTSQQSLPSCSCDDHGSIQQGNPMDAQVNVHLTV